MTVITWAPVNVEHSHLITSLQVLSLMILATRTEPPEHEDTLAYGHMWRVCDNTFQIMLFKLFISARPGTKSLLILTSVPQERFTQRKLWHKAIKFHIWGHTMNEHRVVWRSTILLSSIGQSSARWHWCIRAICSSGPGLWCLLWTRLSMWHTQQLVSSAGNCKKAHPLLWDGCIRFHPLRAKRGHNFPS